MIIIVITILFSSFLVSPLQPPTHRIRMMGWMRVSAAPLTTTTVGAACTFAVAAGRPLCCSRGGVCRYSSVHGARLETAVAIDGVFTKPPKTITTRMHTYTTHKCNGCNSCSSVSARTCLTYLSLLAMVVTAHFRRRTLLIMHCLRVQSYTRTPPGHGRATEHRV